MATSADRLLASERAANDKMFGFRSEPGTDGNHTQITAKLHETHNGNILKLCSVIKIYALDTSTNWQKGFYCHRTASMEQAADTAEAAAVDHYFS